MNSCPESWFSAWQDHIIRFPWRRFPLVSCWCCLFSCGTMNTPVCWVDACHPQLILHSGALSLYLPLCPLWNVAAQGCWYTHPHPAKPTEQTNQNPVQYWGSEKSVGFPGILILCSRAEALPLLRGSESDKHTLSLVKKIKIECHWFDLNRMAFTLKRYELTGIHHWSLHIWPVCSKFPLGWARMELPFFFFFYRIQDVFVVHIAK